MICLASFCWLHQQNLGLRETEASNDIGQTAAIRLAKFLVHDASNLCMEKQTNKHDILAGPERYSYIILLALLLLFLKKQATIC